MAYITLVTELIVHKHIIKPFCDQLPSPRVLSSTFELLRLPTDAGGDTSTEDTDDSAGSILGRDNQLDLAPLKCGQSDELLSCLSRFSRGDWSWSGFLSLLSSLLNYFPLFLTHNVCYAALALSNDTNQRERS
ncbi:hypothetical protein EVAR_85420_1 [Eumeta japonica]|uniref:Uncharacterized protein n=1 Tax=Eumeta variegata TaxID=151549 RepID=A0A4C1WLM7_EUMVA|nr:hypothetical protein EVAR_85420_1 [Eumeta japonica]